MDQDSRQALYFGIQSFFALTLMCVSNQDIDSTLLQEISKSLGIKLVSGAISDITKSYIDGIKTKNPGLNHDIQKAFYVGFEKAIHAIDAEYKRSDYYQNLDKNKQEEIRVFFFFMINIAPTIFSTEASTILKTEDLTYYIYKTEDGGYDLFWGRLDIDNYLSILDPVFQEFFKSRILTMTEQYFREELKIDKPENTKAFRAYLFMLIESNTKILNRLDQRTENIEKLALVNDERSMHTEELVIQNAERFEDMDKKVGQVLDNTNILMHSVEALPNNSPKFKILRKIDEWVGENYGEGRHYSPKLRDFLNETVYVPLKLFSEVCTLLHEGKDVLLEGKPASGKSIIGISVGFEWVKEQDTVCFYIDLSDEYLSSFDARHAFENDLNLLSANLKVLIIIDNTHINPLLANKMVRLINQKQDIDFCIQTICMSRLLPKIKSDKNSLDSNERLHLIQLVEEEEIKETFVCTAKRLSINAGIPHVKFSDDITDQWVVACGGDLVIFAVSFDPFNPRELDNVSISEKVNEVYLDEAKKQPGGKEGLLDICVLNSIEINFNELFWDKKSMEIQFWKFCKDGIIEKVPTKRSVQNRFYRFFHPSLADLILQVEFGSSQRTQWLKRAISLCLVKPSLVGSIFDRLQTDTYAQVVDAATWIKHIQSVDKLLIESFFDNPEATITVLKHLNKIVSWDEILAYKSLEFADGIDKIVSSILMTSFVSNVGIFKYFDKTYTYAQSQEICRRFMTSPELMLKLQNPAADIFTLLYYLIPKSSIDESTKIAENLINNDIFINHLVESNPVDIVRLFKFLDSVGFSTQASSQLVKIVKSNKFIANLKRFSPDYVIPFIEYLDEKKLLILGLQLIDNFIKDILDSDDGYFLKMINSSIDTCKPFTDYLVTHRKRSKATTINRKLYNDSKFYNRVTKSNYVSITTFLQNLDYLWLFEESEILVKKLVIENNFRNNILCEAPDGIASFLMYLEYQEMQEKVRDFASIISEDTAYKQKLLKYDPGNIISLLRTMDRNGFSEYSRSVVGMLLGNSKFMEKLKRTGYRNGILFLRYIDSLSMGVDIDKILHEICIDLLSNKLVKSINLHDLMVLLKYLDENTKPDIVELRKKIMTNILDDYEFDIYCYSNSLTHKFVVFLSYLLYNHGKDKAQAYIDASSIRIGTQKIKSLWKYTCSYDACCTLDFFKREDLVFNPDLHEILINQISPGFQIVRAHVDYPQSLLLSWSISEVCNRIKDFFIKQEIFSAHCFVFGLVEDKEPFVEWVVMHDNDEILKLLTLSEFYNLSYLTKALRELIRSNNLHKRSWEIICN